MAGAPERDPEQLKGEREEVMKQRTEAAKAFAERVTKPEQNTITHYEADPPDEAKRTKFEKQYEKMMSEFLDGQRKRILKAAKEMRSAKPV